MWLCFFLFFLSCSAVATYPMLPTTCYPAQRFGSGIQAGKWRERKTRKGSSNATRYLHTIFPLRLMGCSKVDTWRACTAKISCICSIPRT